MGLEEGSAVSSGTSTKRTLVSVSTVLHRAEQQAREQPANQPHKRKLLNSTLLGVLIKLYLIRDAFYVLL